MDEPPGRSLVVVSAVLIVAGWAVIALGWLGAGRQELDTGQIPYLISGGFGGAGLLLLGAAAGLGYVLQRASWRRRQDTLELLEAVRALEEQVRAGAEGDAAPDEDDLAPRRRTRKRPTRRKRAREAN